jgi:asparagine synthase (glutamine-hydrolysing)
MPGISLVRASVNNKIKEQPSDDLFSDILSKLIHNDDYYQQVLLKEHPYMIVCTKYEHYPVRVFESSDFWVCIEGKIYGKTDETVNDEIFPILNRIFERKSLSADDKIVTAKWLLDTDGDFLLFAIDKRTKDLLIMNDVLGRLPFYYNYHEGEFIASREIQFLAYLAHNHKNENKFDKLGLAQFLLFSHTLGNRTLLSNVFRLEPGSLLRIDNENLKLQLDNLYRFNFEEKQNAHLSIENNSRVLVSLFSKACRNRLDYNSKNIVSLSGGFDSRSVAAACGNRASIHAVTSTEPHWRPVEGSASEPKIAEKIAKALNIPWEDYGIMEPNAKDMMRMLKIKDGLIYLAHSFLFNFLEKIRQRYNQTPINFLTGHGGDILFADLSFDSFSVDIMARNISRVKGFISINDVASITNITEGQIIEEIKIILCSYPEVNLGHRLVHYLFFESNNKLSFEVEDINRIYFWSASPFYSTQFIKYIMDCSDDQKSEHRLYREFLLKLSPNVANIKNSNWGCSIMSRKFKFMQSIVPLYWKYPRLRKIVKKLKDKRGYSYTSDSKIIQCIQDQLHNCDGISNYLSQKHIQKILDNCNNYNHYAIDNLFTIISVIEKTFSKNTSIEKHFN